MKTYSSVRDVAERLSELAHDRNAYSPPTPRESFADKITRAVDERGILLGVLTQKQHRENVERAHARYQNRKPKRRGPSVSR